MKRIVFSSVAILFIFFVACKSGDKKNGNNLKVTADSLYQEVIDMHNEGMVGWDKVEKKQAVIKGLLDSIAALPAKAKKAAAPLRAKLDEVMNDLSVAYDDMHKWMPTLNLDSAKNDLEKRIKYFTEEKLNAKKINDAIFNSIAKADSVLKAKF
jgi:hypothetical protein